MLDIDRWVRNRGSRLLLVYGENDPWSGSAIADDAEVRRSTALRP